MTNAATRGAHPLGDRLALLVRSLSETDIINRVFFHAPPCPA